MTVVFAGGGTGGHLYPAIAIADALQPGAQIAFVGSADRLETRIVPKAGYALRTIAAHALPRSWLQLPRALVLNAFGTLQSLALLSRMRPDLVVATGGYVCFPVAFAARLMRWARLSRAALVLLEPNASPGVTTRWLAPLVDEIWGECGGFAQRVRAKCLPTGVPVRYQAERLPARAAAAARFGLDPAAPILVAIGGSQGARSINQALVQTMQAQRFPSGWQLLLITGAQEYEAVARALPAQTGSGCRIAVRPYLDDMADAYALADLVLARAGASTLAELRALGKPAILVPYPYATQAHQASNAAAVEASGAAVVLADERLAGDLPELLSETTQPQRLAQLRAGAQQRAGADPLTGILARVEALVRGKSDR